MFVCGFSGLHSGTSQLPVVQEAVEPAGGEDDVVDQAHPEDLTRLLEGLGDETIVGAGGDVAGGVVVGADDRGGAVGDGVGEYLPGVHQHLID